MEIDLRPLLPIAFGKAKGDRQERNLSSRLLTFGEENKPVLFPLEKRRALFPVAFGFTESDDEGDARSEIVDPARSETMGVGKEIE